MIGAAAFTIWILALITTFGMLYYEGRNFREGNTVSNLFPIAPLSGDTLFVAVNKTMPEGLLDTRSFKMNNKWFFPSESGSHNGITFQFLNSAFPGVGIGHLRRPQGSPQIK